MQNIIIIWAGAAWLMSAAKILESGDFTRSNSEKNLQSLRDPSFAKGTSDFHIHLFEKNMSPGKKVIISWWGRCNVTTSIEDKKILATKYTRGWPFIRKAMGKFSPQKCFEWFESHGVPLKIQDDLRVFPISNDGKDIVGVFENIFAKHREKITLHYGEWVTHVSSLSIEWGIQELETLELSYHWEWQEQEKYCSPYSNWQYSRVDSSPRCNDNDTTAKFQITTEKWSYKADILVITTGGNAYSHTGSSGDGYAFARSLGHTVTKLWPSLSSFLTDEKWLQELSGLVFEDAAVVFDVSCHSQWYDSQYTPCGWESGKLDPSRAQDDVQQEQKTLRGSLLLTHFGISWPLAFMLSSELAWEKIEKNNPKIITLSPLATFGEIEWEFFLKEQFHHHPKKLITNILTEKLPRRFAEAFVMRYFSHIRETFVGSISRKDRTSISNFLGNGIPITLLERRPGDEFVTAGWVSTDELDADTMASRIHKNLYFAGEVLNVDGYTGGFSLQICWASGYVVWESIAEMIDS